ncbi:MAG: hypothetical protein ACKO9J_13465 [Sphaerospermopsis kisseleviana]
MIMGKSITVPSPQSPVTSSQSPVPSHQSLYSGISCRNLSTSAKASL